MRGSETDGRGGRFSLLGIRLGKKLWNSYSRFTSQIYPSVPVNSFLPFVCARVSESYGGAILSPDFGIEKMASFKLFRLLNNYPSLASFSIPP